MIPAIKKLIENIDQLAIWLHDNPNTPMPSQHKQKVQVVLQKIITAEAISEQEWQRLKPEIYKPDPPKQKQNEQKKPATSKKRKKREKSYQLRAHIVRGGLPSLGKR